MKSLVCVFAAALAVSASAGHQDLPIDLGKLIDSASEVKLTSDGGDITIKIAYPDGVREITLPL